MSVSLNAKWMRVAGVILIAASLGACGVKSSPRHPEGSRFPKQYPTPLPVLKVVPREQNKTQGPARVDDPDSFYQYPNQPPARQ